MHRALVALALASVCRGQMAQNPSPMVEHTRAHPRLKEEHPAGRREKLELGSLYLPVERPRAILFFFHGGTWLPEVAAAKHKIAVVTVQAGTGSSHTRVCSRTRSAGRSSWPRPRRRLGAHFARVLLGGWSAGCGAVRQILRSPDSYARAGAVICIDGIHTDYVDGKPGPLESKIGVENLQVWEQLGRDAIAGRKRVLVTHSEIFPGTFASTTETANYLLQQLGVPRRPVLKWGPMGFSSSARRGQGSSC